MKIESQVRKSIGALIYQDYFKLEALGAKLPDPNDPHSQQAMRELAEKLGDSIAEVIEKQGSPSVAG